MKAVPITAEAFAPYGEVIEAQGDYALINAGACKRFTDLASFDIQDGALGLSVFQSQVRAPPYECDLLERHPLGSQCFVPMDSDYLVIVASDLESPRAFVAGKHQIVNIARNTWHGVLAPISGSGLFTVLDRIGAGTNLEEHPLKDPLLITV